LEPVSEPARRVRLHAHRHRIERVPFEYISRRDMPLRRGLLRAAGPPLFRPLPDLPARPLNVTRNAAWLLGCRISGDVLNLLFFISSRAENGRPGAAPFC